MKKKKNDDTLVLAPYKNTKEETFCIFQMPEEELGIRQEKEGFKKSDMVSPMEGRYTKDKQVIKESNLHTDIDDAYDIFRVERKMTKEEELAKHGVLYHEFPDVSKHFADSDYDKEFDTDKKKKNKDEKIGFSFGVTDINKPNKPRILFEEEEPKQEEKDPELENLTFEELHIFEQVHKEAPVIYKEDENDPSTIILGKKIEEPKVEEVPVEEPTGFTDYNHFESIPENDFVFEDEILGTKLVQKEEPVVTEVKREEPVKVYKKDLYADYQYPPVSLLDEVSEKSTEIPVWINDKINIINQTMADFGVEGKVDNYTFGPQVTRYEIKLATGVIIQKFTRITENIRMNLEALTMRVQAPIPGKSNVGIEVPNPVVRTVQFKELVNDPKFYEKPLNVALGLDIDGTPTFADIAKMPHGLVAGQTGSGKSVCVNALLVSLLLKNSPNDLKLILVDPKKVELSAYSDIPHLLTPVINDNRLAGEALKWACQEMDRRYGVFASNRVKDIRSYNERLKATGPDKMPYIVIFVDEVADLLMVGGAEVEEAIQRIAQLGRACGIHLILATQRPTTDVIKGTIKANIPARIAFKVKQMVDSMTILDQPGAETLLGNGDMLLQDTGNKRLQGAYLTDREIADITDFIRDHYEADYTFTHEFLQEKTKQEYGAASDEEDMELVYNVAVDVIEKNICSINNIQKTFSVGFNRGQHIVDILEKKGVVSPKKGTQGREILMDLDQLNEAFKK